MTQKQVLQEVANSEWQPIFMSTTSLAEATDSILKHHEDYFLGLHDKVNEIIEREIHYAKTISDYQITFADICGWQKELHNYKLRKANEVLIKPIENNEDLSFQQKIATLPNLFINLGLRKTSVKVGNWTPPQPIFLNELIEMVFPISDEDIRIDYTCWCMGLSEIERVLITERHKKLWFNDYLTEWYKIFQVIHPLEDLNGRVGGIVINILYHLLTGEYLINSEYNAGGH